MPDVLPCFKCGRNDCVKDFDCTYKVERIDLDYHIEQNNEAHRQRTKEIYVKSKSIEPTEKVLDLLDNARKNMEETLQKTNDAWTLWNESKRVHHNTSMEYLKLFGNN